MRLFSQRCPEIWFAPVADGSAPKFLLFQRNRAHLRWRTELRADFRRTTKWYRISRMGSLSVRPAIGLVDSLSESEHDGGRNETANTFQTPRRSGGDLNAPPPQRARTFPQEGRIAGDTECRSREQLVLWDRVGAFSVNDEDMQHAIRSPIEGWPAYGVFRRGGEPGPRLRHHIFDGSNFRNLPQRIRLLPRWVRTHCP